MQLARFETVKDLVMEHLIVAPVYGTYTSNGNYSEDYIEDEILKANDDVVSFICGNKDHPRRGAFITSQAVTAIATGGALPESIGGWSNVRIKYVGVATVVRGKLANYQWIDSLNTSAVDLGLSAEDWQGYFDIVGNKLYFTGETAGVDYCDPAPASGTSLTAPIEYETAIRDLALSRFYMKHEDKPNSASFYGNLARGILTAIGAEGKIPEFKVNG